MHKVAARAARAEAARAAAAQALKGADRRAVRAEAMADEVERRAAAQVRVQRAAPN